MSNTTPTIAPWYSVILYWSNYYSLSKVIWRKLHYWSPPLTHYCSHPDLIPTSRNPSCNKCTQPQQVQANNALIQKYMTGHYTWIGGVWVWWEPRPEIARPLSHAGSRRCDHHSRILRYHDRCCAEIAVKQNACKESSFSVSPTFFSMFQPFDERLQSFK